MNTVEYQTPVRLFHAGKIVVTAGALDAASKNVELLVSHLIKHVSGDWGDICDDDKQSNDYAVVDGGLIQSSYRLPNNIKLWIITEADRSVTTLLLPSEY